MSNQIELKLLLTGVQKFEAEFQRVRQMVAVGIGGIAAYAGLSQVKEGIQHVLELGSTLTILKARTDETIPRLIALRRAISENGGSADDAGQLINKMQRAIVEAIINGGAAAKAIADLNLNLQDLAKHSPVEQMQMIGQRLVGIENPAQRAAIAMAIFGRSGGELIPLLTNADAIKTLSENTSTFAQVMERDAKTFHEFEITLSRLKSTGTKFLAGMLDMAPLQQLSDFIREDILGAFDATKAGQYVGAFIGAAKQAWDNGQFGEFIEITIGAGFEAGINVAKTLIKGLINLVKSPTMLKVFADLAMTLGVTLAQALVRVAGDVAVTFLSVQRFFNETFVVLVANLGIKFKDMFLGVVNFFLKTLVDGINSMFQNNLAAAAFEKISGKKFSPLGFTPIKAGPSTPLPLPDFEKIVSAYSTSIDPVVKKINDFLGKSLLQSRGALGIQIMFSLSTTYIDKLKAAVLAYMALFGTSNKIEADGAKKYSDIVRDRTAFETAEKAIREDLIHVQAALNDVETDYTKSAQEKWAEKKRLLETELTLQKNLLELMRARLALPGLTVQEQDQLDAQARGQEKTVNSADRALKGIGPDPSSLSQQMSAAWAKIKTEIGTVQEAIANGFTNTIGAAIAGVKNGITGLIEGTMTWSQALSNIGSSVLRTVIDAVVNMFVAWVTGRNSVKAAELAAQAVELPGKIIAMVATAIDSWGVAAVVGLAALAGAGIAWGSGAFLEGGYTGAGGKYDVAGIVHRGEFVMPADAVQRIGLPALDAMRVGAPAVSPASTGGAAGANIHMAFFGDNHAMATKWARSQEGQAVLVDTMRQNIHRITRT